ncbi:hypothetical protein THAR02_08339 [Trichoderma harzianum]|uniref:Uncharacterized protein n=1 Tax=Trichoderma harzianum TaxID=5544 RepID=A0A0F9X4M3_TRIHA|nr:hypothetical protein THAR02_08339 [Trichoderma harzianum]
MSHEQQSSVQRSIVRTESPPPSVLVQETVTITRDDALAAVGSLIDTMHEFRRIRDLSPQLKETLTEPMVIVLPPDKKMWLAQWAAVLGFDDVERWVERAAEDKQQHSWIKVGENPLLWSSRGPAAILDEMEQVLDVEGVNEAVRRRKLGVLVNQMRLYIPQTEPGHQ